MGKFRPAWFRSLTPDIQIIGSFGAEAITLEILPIQYTALLAENPAYKHLYFEKYDGSFLYRKILGSSVSGENEILTIDEALGFAGGAHSFKQVGFLGLYRLAADRIEIDWREIGRGETTLGLVAVNDAN